MKKANLNLNNQTGIDTKYLTKLRIARNTPKEKENKRIAMYIRVSSREQALNGFGLDAQRENISKTLESDGIDINDVVIYKDDGYSAKDLNRPGIQRLLKDVLEGQVDEVIVYKLDRLARNVIDVYELLQLFIDEGCELRAIVDNLDIHSANGRLLVGVLAIIAQWERETIRERTLDALIEMCQEGKMPIGFTPFGYYKDDNRLYVDETEAKIVRFIFNLACAGNTLVEIERKLNIKYPECKKDASALRKILIAERYYGKFVYQGQTFWNVIPPIITEETYDKAKKVLDKRYKERSENKYYYGNKITCICGEICVRKSTKKKDKKYYYYYCPKCKKRINQDKIIRETLLQIFIHARSVNKDTDLNLLSNRVNKLDGKMKNIYRAFTNNLIDTKTYASTINMMNNDKEQCLERISVLMAENNAKYIELYKWHRMKDSQRCVFIDEYVSNIIIDIDLNLIIAINFTQA